MGMNQHYRMALDSPLRQMYAPPLIVGSDTPIVHLLFGKLENTRSMPGDHFWASYNHLHEILNRSVYHMSRSVQSALITFIAKLQDINYYSYGR